MGGGLAEAYVMRKLHREKTKRMEGETMGDSEGSKEEKTNKVGMGAVFGLRRKVHPNASMPTDCSGKEAGVPVAGR